jgi:4'-phosphopantetheinyl transferase
MEHFEKTLSADECQRAARFHFGKDKNRYVAGRGMLREILGWLLGVGPDELIFSYCVHGKPRLAAPTASEAPLHFNVAHSDSLVVYAVSCEQEVGIDVERIRPIREMEDIAAHVFSELERAQWRLFPDEKKMEVFLNCWVRKEALLKISGEGISKPLNQIEVFFDNVCHVSPPLSPHSLLPALNYSIAVAANSRVTRINSWEWQGEIGYAKWATQS